MSATEPRRPRLSRRLRLVLALAAAVLGLGAAATARDLHSATLVQLAPSPQPSAVSAQQVGQAQSADPLSPFEYAINSVIGRQLNVPGAD